MFVESKAYSGIFLKTILSVNWTLVKNFTIYKTCTSSDAKIQLPEFFIKRFVGKTGRAAPPPRIPAAPPIRLQFVPEYLTNLE